MRQKQLLFWLCAAAAGLAVGGCDHRCGLAEHARVTVTDAMTGGPIACCGASVFTDVTLTAQSSDPEFSLANTAFPADGGSVDAFLVPTSCQKLFDQPYPGATPLC